MYTGCFFNIKGGASMSNFVNNNIDAFTVLIHNNLGSFRKWLLLYCDQLISCIATRVFFVFNSSLCSCQMAEFIVQLTFNVWIFII